MLGFVKQKYPLLGNTSPSDIKNMVTLRGHIFGYIFKPVKFEEIKVELGKRFGMSSKVHFSCFYCWVV